MSQEAISLINGISELIDSLSHKKLDSDEVQKALANMKKSRGFKKLIGEISSVHVLNFGNAEGAEGAQRFRHLVEIDLFQNGIEYSDGSCEDVVRYSPLENLVVFSDKFVLQICKKGQWVDATKEDLP